MVLHFLWLHYATLFELPTCVPIFCSCDLHLIKNYNSILVPILNKHFFEVDHVRKFRKQDLKKKDIITLMPSKQPVNSSAASCISDKS